SFGLAEYLHLRRAILPCAPSPVVSPPAPSPGSEAETAPRSAAVSPQAKNALPEPAAAPAGEEGWLKILNRYRAIAGLAAVPDDAALSARGFAKTMSDSLAPLAFYSRGPAPDELALLNSDATLVFDADPLQPGAPAPVFDAADAFYAPLR